MTRALVTGSTGFVGANVMAELLAQGIEVVGLRRASSSDEAVGGLAFRSVVGDILEPDSLHQAMEGVDWVFHVAAVADYWRTPPDVIYRVNVEGTRNVLQAAWEAGAARFVLTSSIAALGLPPPGKTLLDETDSFNLSPEAFPYGHSKHLAEQVAAEYAAKGMHVVRVLPAIVIGPRDLKFISGELIVQALKGSVPALPPGGNNYIDVRDCAQAHISAAERGRPGERYLLAGHNLTHRQMMEIISQELGTRVPRWDLPRWTLPPLAVAVEALNKLGAGLPLDGGRVRLSGAFMYCDNSKAVRELALTVRPFAESVRDAYQWYKANGYLERVGIAS